jgi:F-type H+-transporting ATPase subunit gamma
MPATKEIKNRIKSIKNTKKITKAMELVAASKMKRAVASTLASRLYSEYSWDILTSVVKNLEGIKNPFFIEREVKNILVVLVTSNRGLCGAYNAQAIKKAFLLIKKNNPEVNLHLLTIGKKGDVAMRRLGVKIVASFHELEDNISLSDITPISKIIIDDYSNLNYDKVMVVYTDFISALNQKPNIKQLLPINKTELKDLFESLDLKEKKEEHYIENPKVEYLFEGDQNVLIENLALKLTKMQIYQMLLESNASEQSSRMMAMKNASEASGEMISDLTLLFNKQRQSNITREISEISAGMASVS